jgi:hypothetical protein
MISKQGNGSVLFCRCNYLKQLNEAGTSGAVSTPSRKRFDAAPPFALVHLAIFQDTASGMARISPPFDPVWLHAMRPNGGLRRGGTRQVPALLLLRTSRPDLPARSFPCRTWQIKSICVASTA